MQNSRASSNPRPGDVAPEDVMLNSPIPDSGAPSSGRSASPSRRTSALELSRLLSSSASSPGRGSASIDEILSSASRRAGLAAPPPPRSALDLSSALAINDPAADLHSPVPSGGQSSLLSSLGTRDRVSGLASSLADLRSSSSSRARPSLVQPDPAAGSGRKVKLVRLLPESTNVADRRLVSPSRRPMAASQRLRLVSSSAASQPSSRVVLARAPPSAQTVRVVPGGNSRSRALVRVSDPSLGRYLQIVRDSEPQRLPQYLALLRQKGEAWLLDYFKRNYNVVAV